jgi:hypothetical protein
MASGSKAILSKAIFISAEPVMVAGVSKVLDSSETTLLVRAGNSPELLIEKYVLHFCSHEKVVQIIFAEPVK